MKNANIGKTKEEYFILQALPNDAKYVKRKGRKNRLKKPIGFRVVILIKIKGK